MLRRRSPARSGRRHVRPASASNICSLPRKSNPIQSNPIQSNPIQSNPISTRRRRPRPRLQGSLSVHRSDLALHHEGGGSADGYGGYADVVSRSPDGRYDVADSTMRAAIMRLRNGPGASAMMAGTFTRSNAEHLRGAIGRAPTEGEFYIAHFLSSDGAGKLIGAATTQPRANAAMFPQAAAANPNIFYDVSGRPRGAGDVYAKLTNRF